MSLNQWTALNGNQVYQNVVLGLLPRALGVSQVVVVSSQASRRQLQAGAGAGAAPPLPSTGGVLVTTAITGNPATRAQVLQLLQGFTGGVSAITASLRQVSPAWQNVQSQLVYAAGVDPTLFPTPRHTPPPTVSANFLSNQQSALGGSAGMPASTLAAIVVVLVVVVLAAGVVAWRNSGSANRKAKPLVFDPYSYGPNTGFTASPIAQQRRPSFGAPQSHLATSHAPRRQSRGSFNVEMTDTYHTYGVESDARSSFGEISAANPAFGRASITRPSMGNSSTSPPPMGRKPRVARL
jgi:hypothetical protein